MVIEGRASSFLNQIRDPVRVDLIVKIDEVPRNNKAVFVFPR